MGITTMNRELQTLYITTGKLPFIGNEFFVGSMLTNYENVMEFYYEKFDGKSYIIISSLMKVSKPIYP